MPSITETLFALGLGGRVVGVTQNCDYPPEAKKIEKIGRETVNLEKAVSLKPDLILLLEDAQKKDIERLKKFGLPVHSINPHNVAEVLGSIADIGNITGATAEAGRLVQDIKGRLKRIEEANRWRWPRKIFVVVGIHPLISAGRGTFISDVVKVAGGRNLADGVVGAYPHYSFEELLRQDPYAIVFPEGLITSSEVKQSDKWGRLSAVKNDRMLFIDPDILFRPGPRVILAAEKIARFMLK